MKSWAAEELKQADLKDARLNKRLVRFVLKSGGQLEELQLETGERIHRALATYSIVAWRLLYVTYQGRVHGDMPCDAVLEVHEWPALYCIIHKTSTPLPTPPTLKQAVRCQHGTS